MIFLFSLFVFISVIARSSLSFHLSYKLIQPNYTKKQFRNTPNFTTPNYYYYGSFLLKLKNGNPYAISKNKLMSFFSSYFGNEADKFQLNEQEKEYLKKIGASQNANYNDLVKLHEAFIGTVSDIKSKLRYKDLFFFILQKLIHKSLYDFKKQQKYNIFKNDGYTSELSVNYVKNSNIEERFKEQLIRKLSQKNKHRFFFLNIFKWKSALEIFNVTKLMIPFSVLGFALPKMSLFSVVVNMIITAHFLTYKKDQQKKIKSSVLLLTLFIILLHSSFGLICNSMFFKYFRLNIPYDLKKESILSLFVNSQLYLASLIYFTNDESDEDISDVKEEQGFTDQQFKEDGNY